MTSDKPDHVWLDDYEWHTTNDCESDVEYVRADIADMTHNTLLQRLIDAEAKVERLDGMYESCKQSRREIAGQRNEYFNRNCELLEKVERLERERARAIDDAYEKGGEHACKRIEAALRFLGTVTLTGHERSPRYISKDEALKAVRDA